MKSLIIALVLAQQPSPGEVVLPPPVEGYKWTLSEFPVQVEEGDVELWWTPTQKKTALTKMEEGGKLWAGIGLPILLGLAEVLRRFGFLKIKRNEK
tara:strand:+ start:3982 stop:4269 length:288 start_codon:yes stop_codon:yes gene_type:complete